MPCLAIHLAVAKKYLEKHPEENTEEFILGSIAADTETPIDKYLSLPGNDKNNRHFGENYNTDNLIEYMKRKVNFQRFFATNDINTSFVRGYFLHLVCDYYFFGEYINDEILANMSLKDAIKIGYNDYNIITPILIKKYNLKIPKEIREMVSHPGIGSIRILDLETVSRFIDEMSNTDLETLKVELLKPKGSSKI